MKEIIGKGLNLDDCNPHAGMMIVVYDLLRDQSQPRFVTRATKAGLVFDLRVNLNKTQCENLIVKPLRDNLVDYNIDADYDKRELSVMRKVVKTDAKSSGKAKPGRSTGKAAA